VTSAVGATLTGPVPRRAEAGTHRFFEGHRRALAFAVVSLTVGLVLTLIVERDPVRPLLQTVDDWWWEWSRDQRWSARRFGLLVATVFGCVVGISLVWAIIFGHDDRDVAPPTCGWATEMLVAQSIPSAAVVPCVRPDATGLPDVSAEVEDGRASFTAAAVEHGLVTVTIGPECNPAGESTVLIADGVCVAISSELVGVDGAHLLDAHLRFTPRGRLDDEVRRRTHRVVVRLSPVPRPDETD
jgi:hypothetical protein